MRSEAPLFFLLSLIKSMKIASDDKNGYSGSNGSRVELLIEPENGVR